MIKIKQLISFIYIKLIFLALFYCETFAYAGTDPDPFTDDADIKTNLPAISTIFTVLGTILVKWLCPLVGAYLLFSGLWDGAHKAEKRGDEKFSWKDKAIFGGSMLGISVLIRMFTAWLGK